MADQKGLKKRLKALMLRPENQICSDCPERKPTWASLIVPPPGAPPGTEKIGAFCCLECSGSHRRLGVHIAFVRSVNLDSWKENEVRSMEYGGNFNVNAIFEAHLARTGVRKPTTHADGPTRERFIRDKYERRKFYDPAGYTNAGSAPEGGAEDANTSTHSAPPRPGAPSEAARQRVATRQARMRPTHSNNEFDGARQTSSTQNRRQPVAAAPVSAPVFVDLLDFGGDSTPAPASSAPDPFAAPLSSGRSAPTSGHDPFAASPPQQQTQQVQQQQQATPQMQQQQQPPPVSAPAQKIPGHEFLTPVPAPPKPADIMSLYNTSSTQNSGYGMAAMTGMPNNMMGTGMMPQQATQGNTNMMGMRNNGGGGMPQGNMMGMNGMQQQHHQQQQQQPQGSSMMGGNPQMNMMNGSGGGGMNPQQMMMQQQQMMMMQQQQQQQQQQPQQSQQQPQMNMMGMMNNNNGNNSNGMMNNGNGGYNNMMQGMQQMNMGSGVPQQSQDTGGFGAPMGGGSPPAAAAVDSSDPFSTLGGMNAFR